ncbi:hypothetical protein, partial [uncultured Boseongicola sp.]|uniref:hypothetical protein n=1 Tax=uncultured Boseongicola sp. TaxID=1648499 RepID=UPI0026332820
SSSRMASSATLALNSGEWFFRFFILDLLSHQAIHLNKWSESPRPPLFKKCGNFAHMSDTPIVAAHVYHKLGEE